VPVSVKSKKGNLLVRAGNKESFLSGNICKTKAGKQECSRNPDHSRKKPSDPKKRIVNSQHKSVLIFSIWKLEEMKAKGNLTYMRHYEEFFDEVFNVYLLGKYQSFSNGNTKFVSLGSKNSYISLLLAPCRLYRLGKKEKIKVFITQDALFSWWTSTLVKFFLHAKVFLIPVAMPHVIYASSGKTMTGILPRFIERFFIKLSFMSAYNVVTGKNIKAYVNWFRSKPATEKKLLLVDIIVDELPSYDFFAALEHDSAHIEREKNTLLYVGRLHKEKLVEDLLVAFSILKNKYSDLKFWIVGDGRNKVNLQKLCKELNIENSVEFNGFQHGSALLKFYQKATVFVSPLTGTSLREAGLTGLPIVCYKMDWVKESFSDGKELLFAEPNKPEEFANKIDALLQDKELFKKLQYNMTQYAERCWSKKLLKNALGELFDESIEND
jgi:glycosyltransferase involved in cell wall biosynthesis